jgi:hypothetical protein
MRQTKTEPSQSDMRDSTLDGTSVIAYTTMDAYESYTKT